MALASFLPWQPPLARVADSSLHLPFPNFCPALASRFDMSRRGKRRRPAGGGWKGCTPYGVLPAKTRLARLARLLWRSEKGQLALQTRNGPHGLPKSETRPAARKEDISLSRVARHCRRCASPRRLRPKVRVSITEYGVSDLALCLDRRYRKRAAGWSRRRDKRDARRLSWLVFIPILCFVLSPPPSPCQVVFSCILRRPFEQEGNLVPLLHGRQDSADCWRIGETEAIKKADLI